MEGWNWITSLCFHKLCLSPSFHHGHHHLLVALVKFLFLLSFLYLYVIYITLLEYFTIFNNPFGFISKMHHHSYTCWSLLVKLAQLCCSHLDLCFLLAASFLPVLTFQPLVYTGGRHSDLFRVNSSPYLVLPGNQGVDHAFTAGYEVASN